MSVDGNWNMKMNTPMGEQAGTLALASDGNTLTGEMTAATGKATVEDGVIDGSKLTWKAKVTTPMPMTLEFDAEVDGDSITGNVKLGAFGNATFTCARA